MPTHEQRDKIDITYTFSYDGDKEYLVSHHDNWEVLQLQFNYV